MRNLSQLALIKVLILTGGLGFLVVSQGQLYAAESCAIESGPARSLTDYISKLDTALGNLQAEASAGSCTSTPGRPSTSENIARASATITRWINLGSTQDCYIANGLFNAELGLRSEIPTALRRDLKLLERKQADISMAIESLYRSCGQDVVVNPTAIIENYSESTEKDIGTLATELLSNHIGVMCAYRSTLTNRPPVKTKFLLTSDDFLQNLATSYGPKAVEMCNVKGDVFKKVKEAIDKLGQTAKRIGTASNVWQAADKKIESPYEVSVRANKETQKWTLKKTGFLGDSSDAALRNAKDYFSQNQHRGIGGYLDDLGQRVAKSFEQISSAYEFTPPLSESATTDEWVDRYKNIQALTTDVGQEVFADYRKLSDLISDDQLTTDLYEGKLARVYLELEAGTKHLEPYREIAKDICANQQTSNASGAGCWQK